MAVSRAWQKKKARSQSVRDSHGHQSVRAKLLRFLHAKAVQYTLLGLLVVDVIILFVELFVGSEFPGCNIIIRDGVSCCPSSGDKPYSFGDNHKDHGHLRLLSHLIDPFFASRRNLGGGALCYSGYDSPQHPAGCDSHKYPVLHKIHVVLFSLTIAILGTFLLELLLMMMCLGPRKFFKKKFYVFDFAIVSTSLALEGAFFAHSQDQLSALAGLLIIARLWRFVRIGHGVVEATLDYQNHKMEAYERYMDQLERKMMELGLEIPDTNSVHHKNSKSNLNVLKHTTEEEEEWSQPRMTRSQG